MTPSSRWRCRRISLGLASMPAIPRSFPADRQAAHPNTILSTPPGPGTAPSCHSSVFQLPALALAGVPLLQVPDPLNLSIVLATGVIALAVIIISIAVAYVMVRRYSRSVSVITEGVLQLSTGNLDHRVPQPGLDATQDLAQALNLMADSVRETIQDLSGERNKLSAVLATMRDGVVVVDSDNVVLMINEAARELLNMGGRIQEGRRLVEVIRDHQVYRLTSDCLSTGETQLGAVELFRPRRFLSAVATPLEDNNSRGVLLTVHDLTQTRQIEVSQKEFVSNVSHELRNPLASVKAMVETLEDGAIEREDVALDFLRRIHHDVDRMNSLVNELLELSQLESGQLALNLGPLALGLLVEDIKSHLTLLTAERDVSVSVELPEHLPQVMADEDRLRRVVINLMENALKFTPPGGQITVCAQSNPEGFVEVTVTDTGSGIPQEHLPHLFERFYKVDRSRHAGGTGLGLAIVKQLIEAHGGEVWAKSQEGVGSTFAFTLPAAK